MSLKIHDSAAKIGVFIVAYNAEKTIASVLNRIPRATWERISEVFIFDDSSRDSTAERAALHRASLIHSADGSGKVRIFRNQVNLGYGGNQKRGYQYAMQHGFDVVVLLHGDGQYAPEVMDRLIDPIVAGQADAVFGSRMMEAGAARRGGMPLYKFVGNKVLTTAQNLLLGTRFSEFHSGYRAYRVDALRRIPLFNNSHDFHFDNEIIVQLHDAGRRIQEVPIPTYYGDEICHVNGLKYAGHVMLTTLRYRLHRLGLIYDKCFDMPDGCQYRYKRNRFSSHNQLLAAVRQRAGDQAWDILDVGCAQGFLAQQMKEMGHRVVGVDMFDSEEARKACSEFHVVDVEQGFGVEASRKFDCVVLADVLEHTRNPEEVLLRAREHLKPDGCVIASTGNVAHLYIRLQLLLGNFTYTDRGILDRTHCRLFTQASFHELLRDCGFRALRQRVTPIPFEHIVGWRWLSDALCWLNMLPAKVWPAMFGFQFMLEAVRDDRASELLRLREIRQPEYHEYQARSAA